MAREPERMKPDPAVDRSWRLLGWTIDLTMTVAIALMVGHMAGRVADAIEMIGH